MRFRITHLRRISYCLSGGVILTAVASFFYEEGGEIAAVPGLIAEGMINAIALLAVSDNDDFPRILSWHYYSVFFYAIVLYGLSWAYTGLKWERDNPIRAKGEIQHALGADSPVSSLYS